MIKAFIHLRMHEDERWTNVGAQLASIPAQGGYLSLYGEFGKKAGIPSDTSAVFRVDGVLHLACDEGDNTGGSFDVEIFCTRVGTETDWMAAVAEGRLDELQPGSDPDRKVNMGRAW